MTGSIASTKKNEPKPKSAIFFIVLGTIVSVLCLPLLYFATVIRFQVMQAQVEGAVGFKELSMVCVGGLFYQIFRYIIITLTEPLHTRLCSKKKDPFNRGRYIEKSTEGTSKACFHIIAFIWGWLVLKEVGWLPWCLGGTGRIDEVLTRNVKQNIPFGSPPRAVVQYGLYTSGYHFSELIRHGLFSESKSDFEEMIVHHIITIVLYFGYFLANMHCIGAFIAVLHDLSDIFISIARVF